MIQRQFRFLPQPINVQIGKKDATISFNEESPAAKEEAGRLAAKASERASAGNYSKAISAWKRALELQPTLRGARLELAMVLVERGDIDGAKNQLIEVLRLNPQDHWACVVLGNLYIQNENDLVTGERFLRRALDFAPNDSWAMTAWRPLPVNEARWMKRSSCSRRPSPAPTRRMDT